MNIDERVLRGSIFRYPFEFENSTRSVITADPEVTVTLDGNVILSPIKTGSPLDEWHVDIGREYIECETQFVIPYGHLLESYAYVRTLPKERIADITRSYEFLSEHPSIIVRLP